MKITQLNNWTCTQNKTVDCFNLLRKQLTSKRNRERETCRESLEETSSSTPKVAKDLFDTARYNRILYSLHNSDSQTPAVMGTPRSDFFLCFTFSEDVYLDSYPERVNLLFFIIRNFFGEKLKRRGERELWEP